jgi:molybdate transport system substrate-binding protein
MKNLVLFCLFMSSSLLASEIKIAVAANVSYAIEELKSEFAKHHPDTHVRVILGSSGKLTAQIRNGAPYGLFMSANMKYPEALYADGLARDHAKVYAKGGLSLFSAKERNFSAGLALLKEDDIKKIAIANPKTAPYGAAAYEAMQASGMINEVKGKLVYAESISQTLSYALSILDIGVVATSSLYSAKMSRFKKGRHWVEVDQALYTPIEQGVVLIKGFEDEKAYEAFYHFIFTPKAQQILQRYGYVI